MINWLLDFFFGKPFEPEWLDPDCTPDHLEPGTEVLVLSVDTMSALGTGKIWASYHPEGFKVVALDDGFTIGYYANYRICTKNEVN